MRNSYYHTILLPIINSVTSRAAVIYFRQCSILKSEIYCAACFSNLKEIATTRSSDKFSFICKNKNCTKFKNYITIRNGSCLEDLKIDLRKILNVIYFFSKEEKRKNISEYTNVSESGVGKICSILRKKITIYFAHNVLKLGGPQIIVEIDESMFDFKIKAHRGRAPRNQHWVFGIVDTSFIPARGILKLVENRTGSTLLPIIQNHVLYGSIVRSDEWPAYNGISSLGFVHERICHKREFVNNETGVHTQHIESYWNKQKNRIKIMMGVKKSVLQEFLNMFMFFDCFRENLFSEILNLLVN